MDRRRHLADLRQFHTDTYSMLHAVLAILTLPQAADCLQEAVTVLFLNGTTFAPASVHWGEFFQQRAPCANPLFTLKEVGFLRSASGTLHFFGEIELADLIDQLLQVPLPDKDLVTQLLHNFHLDDPESVAGCRTAEPCSLYVDMHRLRSKQEDYYWRYGDADTVTPPNVPKGLLKYTSVPV